MINYEQLNFLESKSDGQILFSGSIQDENWKTRTKGKRRLVMRNDLKLSKNELKDLCRKALKIERRYYGFSIFYAENNINKELFIRFVNETTKSKIDVFEFIDLYFDKYAR